MTDHFVDFSAANNGDGTDAAQAGSPGGVGAFNVIDLTDYAATDTIWIRREGSMVLGAAFLFDQDDMTFIGWPKNGDADYGARPASGTAAGWDSDAADYATIESAVAARKITQAGTDLAFRRLEFLQTDTADGDWWFKNSTLAEFTNCHFHSACLNATTKDALRVEADSTLTACIVETSKNGVALRSTANDASYTGCVFENADDFVGGEPVVIVEEGGKQSFEDCDFVSNNDLALNLLTTGPEPEYFLLDCVVEGELLVECAALIVGMSLTGSLLVSPSAGDDTCQPHVHTMRFDSFESSGPLETEAPCTLLIDNAVFSGNTNDIVSVLGTKIVLCNAIFTADYEELDTVLQSVAVIQYPGVYSYDHRGVLSAWKNFCSAYIAQPSGEVGPFYAYTGGRFSLSILYSNFDVTRRQPFEINAPETDTAFCQLRAGTKTVISFWKTSCSLLIADETTVESWSQVEFYDDVDAHRAIGSSFGDRDNSGAWENTEQTVVVGQDTVAPMRYYYRDNCSGVDNNIDPTPYIT